ncbi:MAG: SGNH/GDSL hydrolase family protein [Lentisphaeria bacterium]|jgi:hypothetical protein|nr:SGNH/GDSL hydrolase family protein [Lentisphaeria bacterium]
MLSARFRLPSAAGLLLAAAWTGAAPNLLLNPSFEFHAFANHRDGVANSYTHSAVPGWNTDAWGHLAVWRESHVDPAIRPPFATGNLLRLEPGKRCWQFATLPELGLAHGDSVSLHVHGWQAAPSALRARLMPMKLDSEDGEWTPADFGMADKRTFPRHGRGELVAIGARETKADETGAVSLAIANLAIPGNFHPDAANTSHSADCNTIGLRVEFANTSDQPVWLWWPSLTATAEPVPRTEPIRALPDAYRHIPRTMQKLWKGEAIHILLMGSSIDRGSANPPMYPYDEDPASPTFKQPLSDRLFDPALANRPDLAGYVGWWQHYWSYGGRLRLELMRRFNLPAAKICLNIMACDGSCIGEAHSGLAEYCSLAVPPGENANGMAADGDWRTLHPELFTRPEGPGPDLVIFGSGANEKTDTPDEVAVFEGAIRYIQQRHPHAEFLFCMFQNTGGYTPNPGDLQALALRYGIPFLDYGKTGDDVTRWCNRYALVPRDGHPQAAGHDLWFKQIERAFLAADPIGAGFPQQHLPPRLHPNTYGWEGDMITFADNHPRLAGNLFVFEDTAINCWGEAKEETPIPHVDGEKFAARRSSPRRDVRNSLFRHGRCRLGDRHILELAGPEARLTAVDAKLCPNRRWFPVDHSLWQRGELVAAEFASTVGAPYGNRQILLAPGQTLAIEAVGTDLSVAYADRPDGGSLAVRVDGVEHPAIPANQPYRTQTGEERFLENRRGFLALGYGWHRIELEAAEEPVAILGLFAYDARPNRTGERVVRGFAAPGETVRFSPPFRCRPLISCSGGLTVACPAANAAEATFAGTGPGTFEASGE